MVRTVLFPSECWYCCYGEIGASSPDTTPIPPFPQHLLEVSQFFFCLKTGKRIFFLLFKPDVSSLIIFYNLFFLLIKFSFLFQLAILVISFFQQILFSSIFAYSILTFPFPFIELSSAETLIRLMFNWLCPTYLKIWSITSCILFFFLERGWKEQKGSESWEELWGLRSNAFNFQSRSLKLRI